MASCTAAMMKAPIVGMERNRVGKENRGRESRKIYQSVERVLLLREGLAELSW